MKMGWFTMVDSLLKAIFKLLKIKFLLVVEFVSLVKDIRISLWVRVLDLIDITQDNLDLYYANKCFRC